MSQNFNAHTLVRAIATIVRAHSLSLFFAAAGTIIALARLTPYPGWGDDWAAYVEQGVALATGTIPQQQLDMRFCLENSAISLGPYVYPWGLPFAIAVVFLKTGFSVVAFKAINLVFWGPFLFLFHTAAIRRTNRSIAAVLTTLFVIHPVFLGHVNSIGSDIPFLFFAFSSVLALEHIVSRSDSRHRQFLFWSVLGGIACAMAFLFRTNGIVILMALTCIQISVCLVRRFAKLSIFRVFLEAVQLNGSIWVQLFPVLIFVMCVSLLKSVLTIGGEGHLSMLSGVSLRSIAGHSLFYTKIAASWLAIPALSKSLVLGLPIVLISVIAGFVHLKTRPLEVLFVAGTAVCYVIWPSKQGFRFLFPLVPFVLLWIGETISHPMENQPCIAKVSALFASGILVFFSIRTMGSIRQSGSRPLDDPCSQNATELFSFIQRQVHDNAVVAFRKPRALHLLAHRRSFVPNHDMIQTNTTCLLLIDKNNDSPDWVDEINQKVSSGSLYVLFENTQFLLLTIPPMDHVQVQSTIR